MCNNVPEYAVQKFTAIFSVFYFCQNFKDVYGDPIYRDCTVI